MHKYVKLEPKLKDKIYPKTNHIYNEMIVVHIGNIVDTIKHCIENSEHHAAKQLYDEATELYKQLSQIYKEKICHRTKEAYNILCNNAA